MIGLWVICSFTIYFQVPHLRSAVPQDVSVPCKVERVITPLLADGIRYVDVNCHKELDWLDKSEELVLDRTEILGETCYAER